MKIRALRDEFYLDKNFFPLKDNLFKMLRLQEQFKYIPDNDLDDIVLDLLEEIKPTYKQVSKGV
jgi:hypothetical protein